jgi:DNA-binding Xre family transcriptional regulator
MMNPKIVSTDDVMAKSRKSPATSLLESVGDDYLTMRQMAERYGVHLETMRRICKSTDAEGAKRLRAPSEAIQQGGLVIYLFNKTDVVEVDAYMSHRGYAIEGKR